MLPTISGKRREHLFISAKLEFLTLLKSYRREQPMHFELLSFQLFKLEKWLLNNLLS